MRDRTTLLSGIAANRFSPEVMSLGDAAASERVYASLVSGNYFEVVGVAPSRGTVLPADEDATPGAHPVVVLSHKFWTDRFKADPAIVGQTIRLNNLPYTVVGVAEARLHRDDVRWAPISGSRWRWTRRSGRTNRCSIITARCG